MTALVIRADAHRLPLPDQSVDLIVTSPPYFALRSYTDGGEHYAGQIGSEPTPQAFLEALWACTAEWMRVLKPAGSMWVNLGDKYGRGSRTTVAGTNSKMGYADPAVLRPGGRVVPTGYEKSLMGLPWRYAIGCIDQLGLILRAEVIWSKANGLPESVTDRVRRSHEQWFHLTKQPRYFAAVDEIRAVHTGGGKGMTWAERVADPNAAKSGWREATGRGLMVGGGFAGNTLGKLIGSVWETASEPLNVPDGLGVDHFAAFPTEWPRRIIQGWSPSGICTVCGEGRRPTGDRDRQPTQQRVHNGHGFMSPGHGGRDSLPHRTLVTITGYACACPEPSAPTRPSVILDPFGGTGTTALCASVLGRTGISVDLSHDYSRLARWRTSDPGQRARAARVDKPPVEVSGQDSLFGADLEAAPPGRDVSVSLQGDRTCRVCGYRSQYARKPACDRCGTPRPAAS